MKKFSYIRRIKTNSVTAMGQKLYYITHNVGKVKYLISYHDGIKTHDDGSPFYDVHCTNNKKELYKFVKRLCDEGYVERGFYSKIKQELN